ncbi:LCP family protein [Thermotoga profunda]|uniref:LCP family protein n=1 Tax=Thermotoga profunda TaxID=1508420 RepID=UPI000A69693A|nr:LCP family protein [Thermotoga profunda]
MLILSFLVPSKILLEMLYKKVEKNPYCLLVVGTDAVIEKTVRTDAIMILLVDHQRGKVLISNVPRDLLVGKNKINSLYERSGMDGLQETLKQLLNLDFDGYAIVNYEVFKYLGDKLGPIEIQIKEPMKYSDTVQNLYIDFQPGIYQMKGDELLAYIRYRREAMGDLARIERQKEVLIKLVEKARNLDVFQIASIFSSVRKNVSMNIDIGELIYLFLKLKKSMSIGFVSFPYVINKDGDVVADPQKLADYKNVLMSLNVPETKSMPKVLLLNCSSDKSRGFLVRSQDLWNQKAGVLPNQIVWEDVGINLNRDTVIILNKAKQEEIKSLIKKVYPNYDFVFKLSSDQDVFVQYLSIVKKMSENRIYPAFPYDAVVMVTK